MFWLVAYLERDRDAPATAGPRVDRPFGELSFGERLRYYLAQTWRLVLFNEADVYFWAGLALLLGRPGDVVVPLGAAMVLWMLPLAGVRVRAVMRLDQAAT